MNIHGIAHGSRANGPGLRTVVWFQGCSLACPGCQNPLTHPTTPNLVVSSRALATRLVAEAPQETEGLTISGGEPLQQVIALDSLLYEVKVLRPLWTIGLFTGYDLGELSRGAYSSREEHGEREEMRQVLKKTWWKKYVRPNLDWALCGRYDRDRPASDIVPGTRLDAHAVVTSNQRLWLFTKRQEYSDFPDLLSEVSIDNEGLTQITGFPAIQGER